ncbi:MAG: hypothetical protein RLZZ133_254 [Pseudomonadota bacterium]
MDHGVNSIKRSKGRAVPPALARTRCGCFVPDLTRFTGLQCGAARQLKCTPAPGPFPFLRISALYFCLRTQTVLAPNNINPLLSFGSSGSQPIAALVLLGLFA